MVKIVFCLNLCLCSCSSTVYKHMNESKSVTMLLCPFSSNRVVATVNLGLDAPDNQKAHTIETLLVPNTHRSQLSNPQAGSYGLRSVKHKTLRPFTVKHLKLLEKGCARHMLSK